MIVNLIKIDVSIKGPITGEGTNWGRSSEKKKKLSGSTCTSPVLEKGLLAMLDQLAGFEGISCSSINS